jgi:hypothetical protein
VSAVALPTAPAVRPRGRVAWRTLASVLTVPALLWGTLNIVNLLAHGEHRFTRTFSADGVRTVDVSTDRGSVRVLASDRDDISLHAYISDGLGGTDHSARVHGSRLEVDGSCAFPIAYWCTASYTLRVPRNVRAVLWSGSGDLSASGLRSAADLTSQHGSISASRLRSREVHADTEHGSVNLQFAAAPREVHASSTHGDVTVVVPRGSGPYRVHASTDHGATNTEVRTDSRASRVIDVSTAHGDVTVRYSAR